VGDRFSGLDKFFDGVRDRLKQGQVEYGDTAFKRGAVDLLREVEEEALDICGWGWFVWDRAVKLREKIEAARRSIQE